MKYIKNIIDIFKNGELNEVEYNNYLERLLDK